MNSEIEEGFKSLIQENKNLRQNAALLTSQFNQIQQNLSNSSLTSENLDQTTTEYKMILDQMQRETQEADKMIRLGGNGGIQTDSAEQNLLSIQSLLVRMYEYYEDVNQQNDFRTLEQTCLATTEFTFQKLGSELLSLLYQLSRVRSPSVVESGEHNQFKDHDDRQQ